MKTFNAIILVIILLIVITPQISSSVEIDVKKISTEFSEKLSSINNTEEQNLYAELYFTSLIFALQENLCTNLEKELISLIETEIKQKGMKGRASKKLIIIKEKYAYSAAQLSLDLSNFTLAKFKLEFYRSLQGINKAKTFKAKTTEIKKMVKKNQLML